MDPVTHAIIGATISYALCGNKLGRHAAGLGALAAITPDVDHFISSESDPLLYFRRGFRFRWRLLWQKSSAWSPRSERPHHAVI